MALVSHEGAPLELAIDARSLREQPFRITRVRVGERVHPGQVVGLVGNSGNSTEPHLHFHIADGTSPLGSEGIPYGHDFEIIGRCRMFNMGCERSAPVARRAEVPLANVILRFP